MHVTLAGFVLFLHITVAIMAFMMAGIMHVALPQMARARDVAQMRPWAAIAHRLDPLFPVMALLLLGLGSWLIHLSGGEFRWSDGWVVTAVSALVVIEALSGALLAPKAKKLVESVAGTADGPVPTELHRAALGPEIWYLAHVATFGFAAVVFLMAAKPSGVWSAVIVVLGVVIGVAAAALQLRGIPTAWGSPGGEVPGQRQAGTEPAQATGTA